MPLTEYPSPVTSHLELTEIGALIHTEIDAKLATKYKNNNTATSAPTANDDSSEGYEVGSEWTNITTDEKYACVDATEGAAIWIEITIVNADGIIDGGAYE